MVTNATNKGSSTLGLAETLRQIHAQEMRRPALFAGLILFLVLGMGAVWVTWQGQPEFFLIAFVLAAGLALAVYVFLRLRMKKRILRAVLELRSGLMDRLREEETKAFRSAWLDALDMAVLSALRFSKNSLSLFEVHCQSLDFAESTFFPLSQVKNPEGRLLSLEERLCHLQALQIHVQEGLVESPQKSAHLRQEVEQGLQDLEKETQFLEMALNVELLLVAELNDATQLMRESLGQDERVVKAQIEEFLARRDSRRRDMRAHSTKLMTQ